MCAIKPNPQIRNDLVIRLKIYDGPSCTIENDLGCKTGVYIDKALTKPQYKPLFPKQRKRVQIVSCVSVLLTHCHLQKNFPPVTFLLHLFNHLEILPLSS